MSDADPSQEDNILDESEQDAQETAPGVKRGRKPVRHAKGRGKGYRLHRLTAPQWIEVISMVRAGVPISKIANTFDVKSSTLYRGLKKRGVVVGAYQPVAQEVKESAERRALIEKVKATKERDYKHTELLQGLITKTIAEAKAAGKNLATVDDEVRVLKNAIHAIAIGTKNKWMILGLDKVNENADIELPELPIRELTNDEVAALRDRQVLEDETISTYEVFDEDPGEIAEGEESEEDEAGEAEDDEDSSTS